MNQEHKTLCLETGCCDVRRQHQGQFPRFSSAKRESHGLVVFQVASCCREPFARALINRLEHQLHDSTTALPHIGAEHRIEKRTTPVAVTGQHCLGGFDHGPLELAPTHSAQYFFFRNQNPAAHISRRRPFLFADERQHSALLGHAGFKRRFNPRVW